MTDDNLTEAVARAIHDERFAYYRDRNFAADFDAVSDRQKQRLRDQAKAAIAVVFEQLSEPTTEKLREQIAALIGDAAYDAGASVFDTREAADAILALPALTPQDAGSRMNPTLTPDEHALAQEICDAWSVSGLAETAIERRAKVAAKAALAALSVSPWREVDERLGSWLSAALDDPNVCDEMKTDIRAWFDALPQPPAAKD